MKKVTAILAILLTIAVITAGVLGVNLNNAYTVLERTQEMLATTNEQLTSTKTNLANMTVQQEQTSKTLADTAATLKSTNEELNATKSALVDMTAKQEQTSKTLADTAATLKTTSEELISTKAALADMTAQQEQTAKTLADTEDALKNTSAELTSAKVALADMTAQQEQTAKTLADTETALQNTNEELSATKAILTETIACKEEIEAQLIVAQEMLAPNTPAPIATTETTNAPEATATPDLAQVEAFLVVTIGSKTYQPIPLKEEGYYRLRHDDCINVVHVTRNSINMHEANCENQDCVMQGEVTLDNKDTRILGNMIICLPNQVTLQLYSRDELTDWLKEVSQEDTSNELKVNHYDETLKVNSMMGWLF